MELNKEDNGNRKFILCTNNERNGEEKKLRARGLSEKEIEEHGICRAVTHPRIKKVIEGYETPDKKHVAGLGGNLKYFTTSFVPAQPTDTNKTQLTRKAIDMLCVKEDAFEQVHSEENFFLFRNAKRHTGIVFDPRAIPELKRKLAKIKGRANVYVFSLGNEDFTDDFSDMRRKVKISPIPEAILKVYREIFKPKENHV